MKRIFLFILLELKLSRSVTLISLKSSLHLATPTISLQLSNGWSDFASILGTGHSFRLLYMIKLRYTNKICFDIMSWFALEFQVIHTGVRFPYRYLLYIYEIYGYIYIELCHVTYGCGSVNVTISFFGFPFSVPRKRATRHLFYLSEARNKFLLDEWWDLSEYLPPPRSECNEPSSLEIFCFCRSIFRWCVADRRWRKWQNRSDFSRLFARIKN